MYTMLLTLEIIARHSSTPHATRRAIMCTGKWMIHVAETLMKPVVVTTIEAGPRNGDATTVTTLVAGVRHGLRYQAMDRHRLISLKKFRDGEICDSWDVSFSSDGDVMAIFSMLFLDVHNIGVDMSVRPRPIRRASGTACTCSVLWCIPCVQASTLPIGVNRIRLTIDRPYPHGALIEIDCGEQYVLNNLDDDDAEFVRSRIIIPGQTGVDWENEYVTMP